MNHERPSKERFFERIAALLTFRQLLFAIPLVLTLHNAEEALTMPGWVPEHSGAIQKALPFDVNIQFTSIQLLASLSLATIVPWIVALLCMDGGKGSRKVYVLLLLQAIVLLNVFIPHLAWSLLMGRYNPGVLTALGVNLPFSWYLFRRAMREEYIFPSKLIPIFVSALVIYPIVAWLLHFGGEKIAQGLGF